jgi:choline dehydrogenase-like flavoprotein
MIARSLEELPARETGTAPTVIVGSGAVGLFLAKCLLARGCRDIVVVEAGKEVLDNFDSGSYSVSGRKHDGIRIGRSRSLGGTSNLWGGQLVEFSALDFARRDWVPNSGWPLSLEDLKPYYVRSFGMLGIHEPFLEDAAIWTSVIGTPPVIGDRVEVFLTRWMNVPSLARQLRRQIDDSDSLRVLLGHVANGFRFEGDCVTAVRVRTPGGQDGYVHASTVIVAAGTIETSRLMLAAALEPACPWRDNRMVGRRFQDHLGGRIATIRASNRREIDRIFATVHLKGHKFQPKVRLTAAQIEGHRVLASLGMVAFESSVSEHLNFLKQFLKAAVHSRRVRGVRDFVVHAASCARHLPPLMIAYVRDHRVLSPADASITLVVQAEQGLVDDSSISIDPSCVDSSGLPRVVLDWKLAGSELGSIRELAIQCRHEFAAAGLGTVEIDPLLMDCDPRMLDKLRDTNHPAGGCIMSEGADGGVVDTSLRVFGTRNVYVAGASTFPTSSDSNVTFTAMALACRLADHLTEER